MLSEHRTECDRKALFARAANNEREGRAPAEPLLEAEDARSPPRRMRQWSRRRSCGSGRVGQAHTGHISKGRRGEDAARGRGITEQKDKGAAGDACARGRGRDRRARRETGGARQTGQLGTNAAALVGSGAPYCHLLETQGAERVERQSRGIGGHVWSAGRARGEVACAGAGGQCERGAGVVALKSYLLCPRGRRGSKDWCGRVAVLNE